MIENRDQTLINTPSWEFKLKFGKELLGHGELPLAEKTLKESLDMAIKKCGKDDPRLARIYSALADLYSKNKRFKESEENFKNVLEICEQSIGPNYKVLVKTLEKYSALLKEMKRDKDADLMKQRAQFLSRKIQVFDKLKGSKQNTDK